MSDPINSDEKVKTVELNSGNLDIRNTQALFQLNVHLDKLVTNTAAINETLRALNTRMELYYADCMKEKGN